MTLDIAQLARTVRVLDGAWGTELQKRGLPAGAATELWNVENPDAVLAVAESYVKAGSEIILTNTFGSNCFVLQRHGLADRLAELTRAGVEISRRAAGAKKVVYADLYDSRPLPAPLVFASLGPTGKIVMMGEASPDELAATFAQAAHAAHAGGADAVLLESFAELGEIELALKAVTSACDLPVVVSMTFGSGPDGAVSVMGNTPSELAALANSAGAAAVGANCGAGPENFLNVARLLRQSTDLPIWIKANAGLPALVNGKTTFPLGPKEFAQYVDDLVAAGANFIGGCCGTTPDHIAALRKAVTKANAR